MKHKFSMIVEFDYEDENREYTPPSVSEIERQMYLRIYQAIKHLGFDDKFTLEVAKGSLTETFL